MRGDSESRYDILYQPKAEKQLRAAPADDQTRIRAAIGKLARWPAHGADVLRLQGTQEPLYRLRIGTWRVIFLLNLDVSRVYVLEVLPRSKAYRDY